MAEPSTGFNWPYPPFFAFQKKQKHSVRDLHEPSASEYDKVYTYKNFLSDWKNSRIDQLRYSYSFMLGVGTLGVLGLAFIHPLTRYTPYVMRKVILKKKVTNLIPMDYAKLYIRYIVPRYIFYGGLTGAAFQYASDVYDRAFDTGRFTKYVILGSLFGGAIGKLIGQYGFTHAGFALGAMGGILTCQVPTFVQRQSGNFMQGTHCEEYLKEATVDEIRKWRLQEERLMGNALNKYK